MKVGDIFIIFFVPLHKTVLPQKQLYIFSNRDLQPFNTLEWLIAKLSHFHNYELPWYGQISISPSRLRLPAEIVDLTSPRSSKRRSHSNLPINLNKKISSFTNYIFRKRHVYLLVHLCVNQAGICQTSQGLLAWEAKQ